MDPYILLNLTQDVDDQVVKSAYIKATQEFPPDKDPEMFKMIRTAYETIATKDQRLNYQLFNGEPMSRQTIIYACLKEEDKKNLPAKLSETIFRHGADDAICNKLERFL